jgi:undecaprenyl-diphosphatase
MKRLAAILGLLAAFIAIAVLVLWGSGATVERSLMLAFRAASDPARYLGPAWLPETARNFTSLGSVAVLTLINAIAAACLMLCNRMAATRHLLTAFCGALLLLNVLKWGVARARPDFLTPFGEVFTSSFPSGHAALSATTYLTLAAILTQITSEKRLAAFIVTIALALTFLTGVSRVYLGLHYPSDVLAGWCVGAAWSLACGLMWDRRPDDIRWANDRTRWTRNAG